MERAEQERFERTLNDTRTALELVKTEAVELRAALAALLDVASTDMTAREFGPAAQRAQIRSDVDRALQLAQVTLAKYPRRNR